ncbi:Nif3-like dinuclear metal center hexameric protein [Candidatus Falkowbacteria bacterium]|nr:MAG: Nif3-like dinuclear metal center hexameric protein [Candidatus Falkowbacteria bacterium]
MQVEVKKIVKYCEEYLGVDKWKDYCINGLQVEGAPRISKIITGVSWSEKFIKAAIKKNAKAIMVHHGLFKSHIDFPPQVKGIVKGRLKLLLENNINMLGFHLPLDAHPVIGNNISILKLLGLKKTDTINSPEYGEIGFIGEYKEGVLFNEFLEKVNIVLNTKSYIIPAGPKKVKRVGIVSGGASPDYKIAAELDVDTYICGDVRESIVRAVEETKINFINAGHYNTEKLGVINLGNLIAKKFGVEVEFIDIPCDV